MDVKKNIIEQIIKAGIAAPSADNSQPSKFKSADNQIELYIDENRSGKLSDSRFLLSDIAIGCMTENMLIQANHLGYDGELNFFPEGEESNPFYPIQIILNKSNHTESISPDSIFNRFTNRTFPWKGPLDAKFKNAIIEESGKIPSTNITWLNKAQKKQATKALLLAESLRFSKQEFHQELFSSIDFNTDWKTPTSENLAPASLNVELPARPVFKACRNWSTMKKLNWVGGAKMFGFRSTVLPTLLSPELSLISTSHKDRQGIINAGRAIQRAWLKATELGISVHPMASPGVMSLNFFNKEYPEIKQIQQLMQLTPNSENGIVFLRMGISKTASEQYSKRRPIESFIVET